MKPRVGVFICHCGDNIRGPIDLERLKASVEATCVEDYPYLCSAEGQALIRSKIGEMGLERVVVAACSPNVHEHTFRECVKEAGLNPYLLDIANIREQCAWVPSESNTDRAVDIVRSSIYGVCEAAPLENITVEAERSVMVVGGGIAGMTAALALAKQGIQVHLIEKSATIGGNMVRIGKVFSPDKLTEECSMCSLAPIMSEVAKNKRITVRTTTSVVGLKGHAGEFFVTVESAPEYVDKKKCTSCGQCAEACPVKVKDEWNACLSTRKAAHKPFAQAVPAAYSIDAKACKKCGNCVKACGVGAIDLEAQPVKETLHVGAIIMATGHKELDPAGKSEYGYGRLNGVFTQTELARLLAVNGPTAGRLEDPATGKVPRRIVMVQCVGSRDEKPGSIPYCSKVCCMVALKHANYIKDHFPGTEVYICYTDIRAPGSYENYYREVQKKGVRFIRGRVGEVLQDDGLIVRVEDTLGGGPLELEADMVILSCALEPSSGTLQTAGALGIGLTPELFVREKHPKLDPASTTSRGIFVCGTAAGAKDITDSILQARAAASKAAELVNAPIEIEPKFAVIDPEKCTMCGACVKLCPYGAPYVNGKITIDPISCIGLGGCILRCPEHAISLPGCSDDELFARIDGMLRGGPVILAFLDENIAYVAADNAGVNRVSYPASIRIIRLPSIMRLEPKHLIHALNNGAAGVFLGDGTTNSPEGAIKANVARRVEELKKALEAEGIDPARVYFYEAYLPHYRGLAARMERFAGSLPVFRDQDQPQVADVGAGGAGKDQVAEALKKIV
jgi:heterodisulfide reductase subunit A-like polyferredoxin/coenzyme F420-reducing hydrogenase delta subunit